MGNPSAVKAFAAVIRACRMDRGWSQEELAFQAGIHRNYVSGIERGSRNPSLTTIVALANALGLAPSALIARMEKRVR